MAIKIDTILFDIGGVLMPDIMQAVALTHKIGYADQLGIDWNVAFKAQGAVYQRYAFRDDTKEEDYWRDVGTELGIDLQFALIKEIQAKVGNPLPGAREALVIAKDAGLRIGIASNNTTFWWNQTRTALELDAFVDPKLVFLSHEGGMSKTGGMLDRIAEAVVPEKTLLIDDRPDNLYVAEYLGFQVHSASLHNPEFSIEKVVRTYLEV